MNLPKRNHSLIHHKHYVESKKHDEPIEHSSFLSLPIAPPQRSSSINQHNSTRLTRSSSLSHLHRKVSIHTFIDQGAILTRQVDTDTIEIATTATY